MLLPLHFESFTVVEGTLAWKGITQGQGHNRLEPCKDFTVTLGPGQARPRVLLGSPQMALLYPFEVGTGLIGGEKGLM